MQHCEIDTEQWTTVLYGIIYSILISRVESPGHMLKNPLGSIG